MYFHRGNKILRATLAAIRKSVIPAGKEDVHSIVFLSAVLAESPLLAPIDALPIFGDQAGLDATRYLVATIALQPPKQ